jgi:hypothetical protein
MFFRLDALNHRALALFEQCEPLLQRFGKTELIDTTIKATRADSPDGCLTIRLPSGQSSRYLCEVKRRLDVGALASIIQRLRERESASGMKPLLLAPYINDSLGDRLRQAGISYLDLAGNASFASDPLVYIWLRGFKPLQRSERVTRAFQATGLQLIALLLSRPDAIDKPYRELEQQAGLSLGSISRILSDLRSLGFIRLIAPDQNSLVNSRSLLEHWEFGYATRLRPRLKPQTFRQADKLPMEKLADRIPKVMAEDVLVGGELAAALVTKHLRPQSAAFHIRPHRPLLPLIKEMRLIPDRTGNIVLLEQFGEMSAWRWERHEDERVINPLLVYAELLHGAPDNRLQETAKLIFDQYLVPILNDERRNNQR